MKFHVRDTTDLQNLETDNIDMLCVPQSLAFSDVVEGPEKMCPFW